MPTRVRRLPVDAFLRFRDLGPSPVTQKEESMYVGVGTLLAIVLIIVILVLIF